MARESFPGLDKPPQGQPGRCETAIVQTIFLNFCPVKFHIQLYLLPFQENIKYGRRPPRNRPVVNCRVFVPLGEQR